MCLTHNVNLALCNVHTGMIRKAVCSRRYRELLFILTMEDFYEIDLWDLDPNSVGELNNKSIIKLYGEIVRKLYPKDYIRIRVREYWIIKDRFVSNYEKMRLLIYCYVSDRDGYPINWNHLLKVIPNEHPKSPALKENYEDWI